MRITSTPTFCVLFFDVKIDDKSFKVELEQSIPGGVPKIKMLTGEGNEIIEETVISIITSYLVQKYSISYEGRDESVGQPPLDPPI